MFLFLWPMLISADAQTEVPLDSPEDNESQPIPEVISNHQTPSSGATLDPTPFGNSFETHNSETEQKSALRNEPLTQEEVGSTLGYVI